MPRALTWILVAAVAIAGVVTGLMAPTDPAAGMARVVFPLFLVALIAAGLRAFLRWPHA